MSNVIEPGLVEAEGKTGPHKNVGKNQFGYNTGQANQKGSRPHQYNFEKPIFWATIQDWPNLAGF